MMMTVDTRVKHTTIDYLVTMSKKCSKNSCNCFDNIDMLTRKLCDEPPVNKRVPEFDNLLD